MKKNRKLIRVTSLIKFDKDTARWFCLWDGKVIKKYNGQRVNKSIILPMKRYLDENFYPERVKSIFEMYDARAFLYSDLISQSLFTAELKQIKRQ